MAYNTIRLMDYSNKFKERTLKSAAYPGMLVAETTNANEVEPHGSAGDTDLQRMFLMERELLGEGIDTQIEADERAQVWFPSPGDEVYAILADGQNAVRGNRLASNGDGTLQVLDSNGATVAYALEDVDTSSSSALESEGPRGDYTRRIRVEVV
jgi:hypothetical protein